MVDDSIIDECRELAAVIAPEISQPINIARRPAGFGMPSDVNAVALASSNVVLWDLLKDEGSFFGLGPTIVFNDVDLPRDILKAIFIHELSHLLPFTPVRHVQLNEATRQESAAEIARWHANSHNRF